MLEQQAAELQQVAAAARQPTSPTDVRPQGRPRMPKRRHRQATWKRWPLILLSDPRALSGIRRFGLQSVSRKTHHGSIRSQYIRPFWRSTAQYSTGIARSPSSSWLISLPSTSSTSRLC
jgi:hypothetical protein